MLGAQYVAKAAPDGYTLLLGSAGETAINPYVYKGRMLYSPEKDLAPVTLVTRVPNVLVAGPLQASSVAELVERARAKPGALTYATSGVGNPQHLNGELLQSLAGITMVHVPYKGRVRPAGRRGQRQCRHDLRQLRGRRALHPGRTREGAGGDVGHARQLRQDIPPSPRRRACRPTRWKTGSACTRPRARRRRWCSGCTRRCATRWPIRRWRSACASRAASRAAAARRVRRLHRQRASSTPPSSSAPTSRRTSEEAAMNTDPAGHVAQDWESTCTHT